jgi:hypothetical protein
MRTTIYSFISVVLLFGGVTTAWSTQKLVPSLLSAKVQTTPCCQIVPVSSLCSGDRRSQFRKYGLEHLKLSTDADPSPEPTDDNQEFSANCDDDEECEIDWDAMPDSTSETVETRETNSISMSDGVFYYDDFGFEELDIDKTVPDMATAANQWRTRLEMQWQMTEQTEDCDVYKPVSCGGERCTACDGAGSCRCRFCRGTGHIFLQLPSVDSAPKTRGEQLQLQYEEQMFGGNLNSLLQAQPTSFFASCNICQQKGHETCKVCQGSGWVAGWTNVTIH